MSHVYQPLLIKTLLQNKGETDISELASVFAAHDKSATEYYKKILKTYPIPVLSKHGVISKSGTKIKLTLNNLNPGQVKILSLLCDKKIEDFLATREPWNLLNADPVPSSVRYTVLKEAKNKCELCGISSSESPLDVDHIVPRSKGGSNDISNLQALCYRCNRGKRDGDDTDFRSNHQSIPVKDCLFCRIVTTPDREIIKENNFCIAFNDAFPVTTGHTLIVPRRHTLDYFTLNNDEKRSIDLLLLDLQAQLQKNDKTISGFNIGVNCGESAGQTVMHAHIHLIPRRKGDVSNPRGGIRGVLPNKQKY